MSSAGQILSGVVAAVFVGAVTVPLFVLLRWLERKVVQRKHEAAKKRSAEYAEDFQQRETELEESLKDQRQ